MKVELPYFGKIELNEDNSYYGVRNFEDGLDDEIEISITIDRELTAIDLDNIEEYLSNLPAIVGMNLSEVRESYDLERVAPLLGIWRS